MPEYKEPLREEMTAVLKDYPNLKRATFAQLHKLNSFIKESQRFNPIILITFARLIVKNVQIHDGFTISAGTSVGVPAQAMSMSPDLYLNLEVFDGFRFSRDRDRPHEDGSSPGKAQWAAASLDNMAFGYGRCACPGRHFASRLTNTFLDMRLQLFREVSSMSALY
ncbi:hypothetical protein MMC13_007275 [Lambiella insularis]|nr:hypothetical protein [Lambiella insularis]